MLSNSNAKMAVVLMCHCAPPANNSLEASIVASLLKEVLVGAGADISDLLLLHSELAKLLISEAAARLPDFGVLGVFAVDFLGVAGVEPVTPAALAFSLRLILPKMTLAEAGVYCLS
jgi:hypothetical protein